MVNKINKKGAMELSIGTIVIIVLAMSMLILGVILVQNIFGGAHGGVEQINDKVRDEINKLFVEDKKTVIYLPNKMAEIKQSKDWGVAFAIKNIDSGTAEAGKFHYDVVVSDDNARKHCGIGESEIQNWITTGQSDLVNILPGDTYFGLVRIKIPEGSPLCTVRFHLDVKKDNAVYATDFFDIKAMSK